MEAVWPHIVAEAEAAGDEVGYKAFDGPLMEFLIYTFTSPRLDMSPSNCQSNRLHL